jgi:two-component system, cell cycle sensor histidine kinase and response regulator CckA
MGKEKKPGEKEFNLRERAEEAFGKRLEETEDLSILSPGEKDRLVHELRVHQIELEMQNEELRRTQLALEQARDRYIDLYDFAPIGYFTISDKGMILGANLTGAAMLGEERRFLTRYPFSRFINPDDQDVFYMHRKELLDTKSQQTCELRLEKKDGALFWAHLACMVVQDETGNVNRIRAAVTDIDDRRRAEEEKAKLEAQLHRAQKMEALGLMAGGVAHDLNNILSGIVSYPELILMDLPEESPLRKPIKIMQESGMRAADVVADLLTVARGVATDKVPIDLNTLIKEYLDSLEHQKVAAEHPFISYKTELDPDLLNISCSSIHMKKTLMNLIINASEAIEGSGTVVISTMNRYLHEPLKGHGDVRAGEYALLTVSDDGAGISLEDRDRIFEPFYTKKVLGRIGTGLGLTVVWNTVQHHKGYINVRSGEKGTVFELYFPATREDVAAEKEDVPPEHYLGHGERILVVDDEERQREIACGILTRIGYVSEAVSSGEEAIEYVKKRPVDLIVLDMVMPKGINGRETYEKIIKIRPGQKAVIASGHAGTEEIDAARKLGAGKYIKKPYILEKIGIAVKEELEK